MNWKTTQPPEDRAIWIRANVVIEAGGFVESEPYEGYAQWSPKNADWQNCRNMSIRRAYDAQLCAIEWVELAERAAAGTEEETSVGAHIYHWDDQYRRERGEAGFFALCYLTHTPTMQELTALQAGPFATRAQALGELAGLLTKITTAPRTAA